MSSTGLLGSVFGTYFALSWFIPGKERELWGKLKLVLSIKSKMRISNYLAIKAAAGLLCAKAGSAFWVMLAL